MSIHRNTFDDVRGIFDILRIYQDIFDDNTYIHTYIHK